MARSYDELERLTAMSEESGGYAHKSGPTVDGEVQDTIIVYGPDGIEDEVTGRDAFLLLQHMLRRSNERWAEATGHEYYEDAAAKQARRDAKREVTRLVRAALEPMEVY